MISYGYSRVKCVMDVIGRNVQLLEDRSIGFTEDEQFVCEKLEVPAEWLYYSKAVLAFSRNRLVVVVKIIQADAAKS